MNKVAEDPVIEIEGLGAGYDGDEVLRDIDLALYPRDFLGLIGPNGGGKTTLLKVILGLIRPQRGRVSVLGRPVRETRHRIGYVPQAMAFDKVFPIRTRDVVRMGRLFRRGMLHRFEREDDRIVDEALASVELGHAGAEPFGDLSGGERQRALIARALAVEPEILLLDEPTASVDARIRTSVFELLHHLNQRLTILMVTHDMAAISTYVKTVGCLNRTLHYHGGHELTPAMVEETYQCPVELIAHGVPHRVLAGHTHAHPHDHSGEER